MKVKGERITKEHVEVDITPSELFNAIEKAIDEKYKPRGEYIQDGIWKVYEYTHPHNGDDQYKHGAVATSEEIRIQEIKQFLRKVLYY